MTAGSRSIAVLLAATLLGPAARAVADSRPSERDRQLASDLVKKAIARSSSGDHAGAIDLYNKAYTLVPNSLLLSNIGAEFQQDGMFREALDYFCKYLQEDPSGTNAPYARAQAKLLQRQLGHKKMTDRDACAARDDGDDASSRTGAGTGTGRLDIGAERSDRGDRSVPDRPDRTERDAKRPEADAREPRRADSPRTEVARADFDHRPGDAPTPLPVERDAPLAAASGNTVLMYTGVGVGVAGLIAAGIGIYDGFQARDVSDQISSHDQSKAWPEDIRELESRGQHYENLQIGFLIASGVLAATGVVLYVVSRPDSAEHGQERSIAVAPTTNGLSVFGRF
jgi:tetratricopeptide (TPR) repeat protein